VKAKSKPLLLPFTLNLLPLEAAKSEHIRVIVDPRISMHRPPCQPVASDARDDHFAFFQVGQKREYSGLIQHIRSQVFHLEAECIAGFLENIGQGSGLVAGGEHGVFGPIQGGQVRGAQSGNVFGWIAMSRHDHSNRMLAGVHLERVNRLALMRDIDRERQRVFLEDAGAKHGIGGEQHVCWCA
jgi:hypothetical protein